MGDSSHSAWGRHPEASGAQARKTKCALSVSVRRAPASWCPWWWRAVSASSTSMVSGPRAGQARAWEITYAPGFPQAYNTRASSGSQVPNPGSLSCVKPSREVGYGGICGWWRWWVGLTALLAGLYAGEDPLVDSCTVSDLDSVAGTLKLYFRSLEPSLFPPELFMELLACAGEAGPGWGPWDSILCHDCSCFFSHTTELEASAERVEQVCHLLGRLPGPVQVVLRYLFTFLNQ